MGKGDIHRDKVNSHYADKTCIGQGTANAGPGSTACEFALSTDGGPFDTSIVARLLLAARRLSPKKTQR